MKGLVKDNIILGIESSCDDTSAAVLINGRVHSNVIANQEVHAAYGGVVPELHQEHINRTSFLLLTEHLSLQKSALKIFQQLLLQRDQVYLVHSWLELLLQRHLG